MRKITQMKRIRRNKNNKKKKKKKKTKNNNKKTKKKNPRPPLGRCPGRCPPRHRGSPGAR